jgi:hypothetical protein
MRDIKHLRAVALSDQSRISCRESNDGSEADGRPSDHWFSTPELQDPPDSKLLILVTLSLSPVHNARGSIRRRGCKFDPSIERHWQSVDLGILLVTGALNRPIAWDPLHSFRLDHNQIDARPAWVCQSNTPAFDFPVRYELRCGNIIRSGQLPVQVPDPAKPQTRHVRLQT